MNKSLLKFYFEWCCILYYSIQFGTYAFAKPLQFENRLNNPTPVNELSGFRLMWAFYGYSTTYPIIIGIFQLLSILLIIPKRTRILGCMLGTIILSNIILQDIIYGVPRGALFNAIILQITIFIILYFNKKKLIEIFNTIIKPTDKFNLKEISTKQKIITFILAFGLFILVYLLFNIIWVGITAFYEIFDYFKNLIFSFFE